MPLPCGEHGLTPVPVQSPAPTSKPGGPGGGWELPSHRCCCLCWLGYHTQDHMSWGGSVGESWAGDSAYGHFPAWWTEDPPPALCPARRPQSPRWPGRGLLFLFEPVLSEDLKPTLAQLHFQLAELCQEVDAVGRCLESHAPLYVIPALGLFTLLPPWWPAAVLPSGDPRADPGAHASQAMCCLGILKGTLWLSGWALRSLAHPGSL